MADAYMQRAYSYREGKLSASSTQVLDDLNRAIELQTTSADAYVLRGIELENLKDHNAAICDFNHALRLDPRSSTALAYRAVSKISIGNLDDARLDIRKAIDLHPSAEGRRHIEELIQLVNSREQ
jgi:Tfp pilus assembly protein PilF